MTRLFKGRHVDPESEEYYSQTVERTVAEVLMEERKNKEALKNNKKLHFPCLCGATCSFAEYLRPIISAFDKLYLEYVALHQDYTNLFKATWVKQAEGGQTKDGDGECNKSDMVLYSLHDPPPFESRLPSVLDPDLIKIIPAGVIPLDKETQTLSEEDREDVEELRMEIIRMRTKQNLVKQTIWTKLWPYIFAYKVCLCIYCDYRECVRDYQTAIQKLKSEYDIVYQQYEVLFGSVDMLPPEGHKKIIMLSRKQYIEEMEWEELKNREACANPRI